MDEIDIVVWDLETSGFVAPESKILEIGVYIIRGEEIEMRSWLLNNNIDIPEKITEITGITNELIATEGRDPTECILEFLPLLSNAKTNITHNGIRFDIPFLCEYVADLLKWSPQQKDALRKKLCERAFDTAVHFKAMKTNAVQGPIEPYIDFATRVMQHRAIGVKFNLTLCAQESNINLDSIELHRALADVYITYELYKLINNKHETKL